METYLSKRLPESNERDLIKKTRFGEIVEGLRRGGAYAFDEEAYKRFSHHAKNNGMDVLPAKEAFSGLSVEMHFIRIQMLGG